jgi:TatD DNase family protein
VLIDTHAHLDSPQFDADRAAVVERAQAAGVEVIVNAGADMDSSRRTVALAEQYPEVYAGVGVHPHDAKQVDGDTLAALRELARQPKVVAVGEIGLDFYRNLSPQDVQRRAFQAQLALAARLGKPVIVHDREAHAEVLKALTSWAAGLSGSPLAGRVGVLHSFSGDLLMAKRAIDLGFYISISGPVTYQNAGRLVEIIQALPLNRLLIETDCPYLTPHPHRGRRNEPANVRLVAEKIADIKGLTLDMVAAATTANARRLFELEGS